MNKLITLVIIVIIALVVIGNALFTVDETDQVVITQFGRPVGDAITSAGLHFKMPFIQKASSFKKTLLEWDGDPGQIPTLDKTYIWVDTFARWKIVAPLKFFETVNNETFALKKLDDIIDPATRNFITSHHLIEVVRNTNRDMDISEAGIADETLKKAVVKKIKTGRAKIAKGIMKQASPKLAQFGIELEDMRFKRINYIKDVRKAVYGRMIAERKQIAEKFRSEGKGESMKIAGDMEKELKRIKSGAYKTAQEIKGKSDAEATRIYASAYNKDPEFYSFVKTMEIYKDSLDKDTWLMLSTNSDFFKYLKKYKRR
ncbi:MAG: protease modulator HflC [Thermodesulfobacteriota bacterium]|nr:protease modulator HflC [Thermodesulfobacteriota bacterium]